MAVQREWLEKDYYKVLGVAKTATDKEIARAYRKLAKQYHPDANPGSEERFKEISAAYDVLGDQAKRKEYDEVRTLCEHGFAGNPFGGAGGPGGQSWLDEFPRRRPGRPARQYFRAGPSRRLRAERRRAAGPERGHDLETELHLSFADAVKGVTTTVNVTSDAACSTCGGTGCRARAPRPTRLPGVRGQGVINENQGMFSFSHPCVACGGTGMQIEVPCPTCGGQGTERRARQVKVRIPPASRTGSG